MDKEQGPTRKDLVERLELPEGNDPKRLQELVEIYKKLGLDMEKGVIRLESGYALLLQDVIDFEHRLESDKEISARQSQLHKQTERLRRSLEEDSANE